MAISHDLLALVDSNQPRYCVSTHATSDVWHNLRLDSRTTSFSKLLELENRERLPLNMPIVNPMNGLNKLCINI